MHRVNSPVFFLSAYIKGTFVSGNIIHAFEAPRTLWVLSYSDFQTRAHWNYRVKSRSSCEMVGNYREQRWLGPTGDIHKT